MRRDLLTQALLAALGASLVLASPASAGWTISQADTPDPVRRGENVSYTVTVTNTSTATDYVRVGTLLTRKGSDVSVPNPYVSFSGSAMSCREDNFPSRNGTYYGLDCDPATVPAGGSVQLDAVVQGNESMEQLVALSYCGPDPYAGAVSCDSTPFTSNSEPTSVLYPPELSGSSKIRLRGLPDGCVAGDLELTARAMASGVRKFTASISFPHTEWGGVPAGSFSAGKIGSSDGGRLSVEVTDKRLRPELFYEIKFIASRSGGPRLKRTVTVQGC